MQKLLDLMRFNPSRKLSCDGRWTTPWSGGLPVILILIWSVISIIGFEELDALLIGYISDPFHQFLTMVVFFIFAGSGFYFVLIRYLRHRYQISVLDLGLSLENWQWIAIVGLIIGSAKSLIVTIPVIKFFPEYSTSYGPPGSFYREPSVFLLSLIIGVIIGPFFEELILRGLLYGFLRKRLGIGLAIGLNALIFAILHNTYPQIIAAFLTGLITCSLYERTGSLLLCIVIHGSSNLCTSIEYFILVD